MIQKPFLKWVGGKTQLIDEITNLIPNRMNNYHEIFVGGGSVLFLILSLQKENKIKIKNKIYAYDLNSKLINTYINIQNNNKKVYKYIEKYINEYENIKGDEINRNPKDLIEAKTSKESYYYYLRNIFNKLKDSDVKCSALFIILNKLCFRGLYRESKNGFNVPFGHYKKTPSIISKDELNNISSLIKNVEFKCMDFNTSMKNIEKNDFVYLDPPYYPEDEKSFVGYTIDGFDKETHIKLFKNILSLKSSFLLSNSNVSFVNNYMKKYKIKKIECRRAINSKDPSAKTFEVLITNF